MVFPLAGQPYAHPRHNASGEETRCIAAASLALDPGGFWYRAGAVYLGATLGASIRLVRLLRTHLSSITANGVLRSLLLVQLSSRPWRVDPAVTLAEMRSFADTTVFDEVLRDLVTGPPQEGMLAGTSRRPVVIAWGRRDRVTLARQAQRAAERFPDADLHWFRTLRALPPLGPAPRRGPADP